MGEIKSWVDGEVYLSVLKKEVAHLNKQIQEHDTGHIHTTIGVLNHRIQELESQKNWPFPDPIRE